MNPITVENDSSPIAAGLLRHAAQAAPEGAPQPGGKAAHCDLYTVFEDGSALCDSRSGAHYCLTVRRASGRASVHHIAAAPSDLSPDEGVCHAESNGRRCRHRGDLAAVLNHEAVRGHTERLLAWTLWAEILTTRCHCGGKTAEVSVAPLRGRPSVFRLCLAPECRMPLAPARMRGPQ